MTSLTVELVFVVDPKLIQNNFNNVKLLIHALNIYVNICLGSIYIIYISIYAFNIIIIVTGKYAFKIYKLFFLWKHVLDFQMCYKTGQNTTGVRGAGMEMKEESGHV